VPGLDWVAGRNPLYTIEKPGGPAVPDAGGLRAGLNPAGQLPGFQSASQVGKPTLLPLPTPLPYQLSQTMPARPTLPSVSIGDTSPR
jgi:hypothetical protein